MKMEGEYRIAAARQEVWQALNDPEVLKASIPGCEALEKVSDTDFTATVLAKVGPVRARFKGKVTLSDLDPPNGYTISGEGQGGTAGFARGSAKISLSDDAGATVLRYEANARVGGKLAQIGSRLIDATARKMADNFFAAFTQALAVPAEKVVAEEAVAAAPGLRPQVWITALIILIAVILFIYALSG